MQVMRFSLRLLRQDWRAGELKVLAAALVVAVASVTSVGFFADRVERALTQQANALLGADVVIAADHPVPERWRVALQERGLAQAETRIFLSMVAAGENLLPGSFPEERVHEPRHLDSLRDGRVHKPPHPIGFVPVRFAPARGLAPLASLSPGGEGEPEKSGLIAPKNGLAEIKAVSEGYPLRGELRHAPALFAPDAPARGVPEPGTVWVEARLLGDLSLDTGDMLNVGAARLRVAAVLSNEPDRGGSFFNIAPRVMLNLADLPATQLIQPASRVQYRLLAAGAPQTVEAFRRWAVDHVERGERVESVEDARPEMRAALERARRFLGLASIVSVLIAGVAVAAATRRFVTRHLDSCAIMRCLGAPQGLILRVYALQMLWLGLGASALGCVLGYFAQTALADVIGPLAAANLPLPSLWPVAGGLLTGLLALLGFALPPLLHLRNVPTLRVLRQDLGALPPRSVMVYLLGFAALAALLVWQAGEVKLALYVLGGGSVALLILNAAAGGLLALLAAARARGGAVWRFGIAQLVRRRKSGRVQAVAVGLGIMALLLLGLVRVDLLEGWKSSLPPDAHNRFVINIQPGQVDEVRRFFTVNGQPEPELYPMVRGRLTAIGGREVGPEIYADERAQRLAEREFNLSWSATMQPDNALVTGEWWDGEKKDERLFSVEEGIARTLGIKLGDTLTFDIAGEPVEARVANLRKVEWDSFHVNFFVIASPAALKEFPAGYITSFYLPPENGGMLRSFVRQFPNVTVIDVAAIMNQVRHIIERVSRALEYVFLFTLAAGGMVLYAALQATLDERIHESAVLRTLGAVRRQLLWGMAGEFALIGALAGFIAATAAALTGYVLAEYVFNFHYSLNLWLWPAGIAGGALAVGAAGVSGTRFILNRPPWETLRGWGRV